MEESDCWYGGDGDKAPSEMAMSDGIWLPGGVVVVSSYFRRTVFIKLNWSGVLNWWPLIGCGSAYSVVERFAGGGSAYFVVEILSTVW